MAKPTDAAETLETAIRGYPVHNLDLLVDELFRQRDAMNIKVGNTYTRAAILIGAAGVLGGLNITASAGIRAGILLASLALYAIAAVCGLAAMRPRSGDEVDVVALVKGTRSFTRDSVLRAVFASNIRAHGDYKKTLRNRTRWIVAGFLALTLAWVGSAWDSSTSLMSPSDVPPTKVQIVEGDR